MMNKNTQKIFQNEKRWVCNHNLQAPVYGVRRLGALWHMDIMLVGKVDV